MIDTSRNPRASRVTFQCREIIDIFSAKQGGSRNELIVKQDYDPRMHGDAGTRLGTINSVTVRDIERFPWSGSRGCKSADVLTSGAWRQASRRGRVWLVSASAT